MFTLSPITSRPASGPGALPHFGAECSCGTIIRSTMELSAKSFACEHIAWHEGKGETVKVAR